MKATAWRQFSPAQTAALLNSLKRGKPQKVFLAWVANDNESLSLAAQFSHILEQAQWSFTVSSKTFPDAVAWDIRVPDTPNAEEATDRLRSAFAEAGIKTLSIDFPEEGMSIGFVAGPGAARILFGSKRFSFGQPPN